jgi:hypothetical protein
VDREISSINPNVKIPMTNQSSVTKSKNILRTIIYYDILDYPLTVFELWKYLIEIEKEDDKECSLGEVIEMLESEELKRHIEDFRGFYFLKGRSDLVEKRIQNDKNSIAKYKIAKNVAWWLRFVPFVRMIAVTGTLAMKNSEKNSDIDFFVVLEKGRLFTGRFLVTAMVHIFGKRRYGKKIKNRICLNYFITAKSLEIKRKDLFAANEYSFIYPLFGFDVFQKFCRANIEWINKFKPNYQLPELKPAQYYSEHSKASRFIQNTKETLINILGGDRIEVWLKRKQVEKIKRNPLTYKKGGYVEYNEDNLVFLPEPQGVNIQEIFSKRILLTEKR